MATICFDECCCKETTGDAKDGQFVRVTRDSHPFTKGDLLWKRLGYLYRLTNEDRYAGYSYTNVECEILKPGQSFTVKV